MMTNMKFKASEITHKDISTIHVSTYAELRFGTKNDI